MVSSFLDLPVDVLHQVTAYLPLQSLAHLRATSTFNNQLICQHFPDITFFQLLKSKYAVIRVRCGPLGEIEFKSTLEDSWQAEDAFILDLQYNKKLDKLSSLTSTLKNRFLSRRRETESNKSPEETLVLKNGLLFHKKATTTPRSYNIWPEIPRTISTSVQDVFESLMALFHDLYFVRIRCEVRDVSGEFPAIVERSLRLNHITTEKIIFEIKAQPALKKMKVTLPWEDMRDMKRFQLATDEEKPSCHLNLTDEDLVSWDFNQLKVLALTQVTAQGMHRLMDQFLDGPHVRGVSIVILGRNPLDALNTMTEGFEEKGSDFPWYGFCRGNMRVGVQCCPIPIRRGQATFLKIVSYPPKYDPWDDEDYACLL